MALECKVFEIIHSGTHDIFMADIVNVSCDEKILDEKGRICYDRAGLLAYSHGEYFALGRKIGKFGFSTDKKSKSKLRQAPPASKNTPHKNDGKRGRSKK